MEEEFNDIFTGYENNLQKAVALVKWQKSEIECLNIHLKTFSFALKNLEKERHEVAIEIFAKLREAFYEEGSKLNNELSKAIRENNHIEENTLFALDIGVRDVMRIIADCEAKYLAGANKSEILYGGPREGGKKHAEKETEEWKKRGKL